MKSKGELVTYEDEYLKHCVYSQAKLSLTSGKFNFGFGTALETDTYSLSWSRTANLSLDNIRSNSVGKASTKVTLSNKPEGNIPKVSISLVTEEDPLRIMEASAVVTIMAFCPNPLEQISRLLSTIMQNPRVPTTH